ncbi:hypothetical protein GZL_05712 [Streptomyces sp. 769]|nr:hypothetical protein GZL_05712 [Streptomyces sp. 769]
MANGPGVVPTGQQEGAGPGQVSLLGCLLARTLGNETGRPPLTCGVYAQRRSGLP